MYLACKCLLWHCMLIHTKTIKTFNMQKNCLTIETLYLFINRECNHKHKEIFFFQKIYLKNILNTVLVLLFHTYKQNVMILSKKLSNLKCKTPVMNGLGLNIVDSIDFL